MSQYFRKTPHEYTHRYPILKPRTAKEWFMLWLSIVVICILLCLFIMIMERPLDTNDFIQYIRPKTEYEKLTSEQLKYIDPDAIPGLTDFMEDEP